MLGITRNIERAYFYPVVFIDGPTEIRDYINRCFLQSITVADIDNNFTNTEKADIPSRELIQIPFTVKNFGKTPGTLYRIYAEVGFWPKPTGSQSGISIDKSILGYGDETEKLRAQMWIGLSRNQVQRINTYTGYLALTGQFVFDDTWGKKYSTEFLFVWDKNIERITLRNLRTHEGTWDNLSQTFISDDNAC